MRTLCTLAAALVMSLTSPLVALACPVCGTAGANDNGWAYFAMTIVLSGLPLVMIGGVGLWVYRRASTADRRSPDDGRD